MGFFLVEIDIHGSIFSSKFLHELVSVVSSDKSDPNSFFHWLNIQLFHYIITALEYCHVERRKCFNA